MTTDQKTAEKILSFALSQKADAAEVFIRSSVSTNVEVKDQKIEAFDRARDAGAGLRVIREGRMGFAFTADLSDGALKTLAQSAVTNARNTDPDPFQSIPERPIGAYQTVNIYDPALVQLNEKEKIERVMAMEREAFAVDKRIKRTRKASASFSESETVIMNSHNASVFYKGTAGYASIEAVAEDKGESQAGSEFEVNRFYHQLSLEDVGRRAARKAINLLGAKTVETAKAPVILDRDVVGEFLSIMAFGFSAENVQKKKSLFMGKLDKEIVSTVLTVLDDGLLEGGIGTAPSDDEAVPMRKKTVIEKGRLMMFLYNTYTAKKEKTISTGNGMRGGFKGVPGVGITNLYITPGAQTPEDLIRSTKRGLQVTEIMGAHMANPISGDFSVGATGFWIENGTIAYPVREITIAGNILDLMKNVDAVANDLRFQGRIGSPSLRVKELSIGGK
jgi:PmbA protein